MTNEGKWKVGGMILTALGTAVVAIVNISKEIKANKSTPVSTTPTTPKQ
jgi:hypothetical protein